MSNDGRETINEPTSQQVRITKEENFESETKFSLSFNSALHYTDTHPAPWQRRHQRMLLSSLTRTRLKIIVLPHVLHQRQAHDGQVPESERPVAACSLGPGSRNARLFGRVLSCDRSERQQTAEAILFSYCHLCSSLRWPMHRSPRILVLKFPTYVFLSSKAS